MSNRKKSIHTPTRKIIKILKNFSNSNFFKYSGQTVRTLAFFALIGTAGSLELNHISFQHALIQSAAALIIIGK